MIKLTYEGCDSLGRWNLYLWRRLSMIVTLFIVFILSNCGDANSDISAKVLRYNHTNPVSTLDPAFAKSQNAIWATHHIYSTLFNYDSNTVLQGNLVEDYSLSPDGLTYQFDLVDSVYFHSDPSFGEDGTRQLTSRDVKYSLERLTDEAIQSPGSWVLDGRIAEVSIIDSLSFEIRLVEPFAPFLGLLATKYCAIVPSEAIDFYGSRFRSNPVGTGPFKLKRWIEGEVLFLEANPNYFKGAPLLDGIKANYITDKKIAFLSLLHGDIDYISGLESTFSHRLIDSDGNLLPEISDQLSLQSVPYLNTEYIGINLSDSNESVLSEKTFRQGLNYAIDRTLLLKTLRNTIGYPAVNGIVHPGLENMMNGLPAGYDYDPQKAAELIEASGYKTKYNDEVITISTNADYLDIITFVARQWDVVGVKVKIDVLESSILRQGMRNGDIPMFRASWIADYPDPENFLTLFYGENPAPPNYTRMHNAEFDQLYRKAKTEPDTELRKTYYTSLDRMVVEEAPVIFLFYDASAIFYSNTLQNVELNALNYIEVEHLDKLLPNDTSGD